MRGYICVLMYTVNMNIVKTISVNIADVWGTAAQKGAANQMLANTAVIIIQVCVNCVRHSVYLCSVSHQLAQNA